MPIRFFYEEVDFKIKFPRKTVAWLNESSRRERKSISDLNIVFCTDNFLFKMNKEYLHHNTLTDIITFDYSNGNSISGEIFISIERVAENSQMFNVQFQDELLRVIIHGVLHLSGYKDKKLIEVAAMRKKEEAYLSLWKIMFHVKR
jgi:probable rRNA maturation factor